MSSIWEKDGNPVDGKDPLTMLESSTDGGKVANDEERLCQGKVKTLHVNSLKTCSLNRDGQR